ncbi:MAG: efflux RND transporter periplasmic adaptor subunit [Deltaproteobacteria bacterium]|jgi:membrane fusion protein (multidrug efflux system)|nr:efflux RND transporter periplasmic adaptor subunit [Deltaproteobacteria bacterium]
MKDLNTQKSHRPKKFNALALIVLAAIFSAFFSTGSLEAQPSGQPPLLTVGAMEVTLSDFPVVAQYYGLVEGRTMVEVYSEVSGRIHKQAFQEGAWVEKDQILYEIDSQAAGARVLQVEASVNEAQVRLDYAEAQLGRMKILRDKKAISGQEYEVTEKERNLAVTNLSEAKARLEQIKAEAALSNITAPVSGYVGTAEKKEGELVAPGTRETAYMTSVEDMSAVKVVFYVPENHVRRYRDLSRDFNVDLDAIDFFPATMTVDGQLYPYPGQMEYGSARVERGTGVMASRAAFPNPDLELFSGQVVKLGIQVMVLKNVLAIPQTAFSHGPDGLSLAVLKSDNTVEFRPISSRALVGGYFILSPEAAGVAPGEQIVIEGLTKIRNGQKVQPIPTKNTSSDQSEDGSVSS